MEARRVRRVAVAVTRPEGMGRQGLLRRSSRIEDGERSVSGLELAFW